jgi:hypothetical protein
LGDAGSVAYAGKPMKRYGNLWERVIAWDNLLLAARKSRRGRERFIVYFEFYTYWDRDAPWDMLGKSGPLSQRTKLPTICMAFVLLQRFASIRSECTPRAGAEMHGILAPLARCGAGSAWKQGCCAASHRL